MQVREPHEIAEDTRNSNMATVRTLAQRFLERAEALQYKGKARDRAALDYFVGAATLAEAQGNAALTQHLSVVCSMMIAIRGTFAVRELAERTMK